MRIQAANRLVGNDEVISDVGSKWVKRHSGSEIRDRRGGYWGRIEGDFTLGAIGFLKQPDWTAIIDFGATDADFGKIYSKKIAAQDARSVEKELEKFWADSKKDYVGYLQAALQKADRRLDIAEKKAEQAEIELEEAEIWHGTVEDFLNEARRLK